MIRSSKSEYQVQLRPETYPELLRFVSEAPQAIALNLVWMHETIAAMTREVFSSEVRIVQEADAEVEDDVYFAVKATARGEVDTIVHLMDRWHSLCREIAGELATIYRLDLDIQ